MKDVLTPILKSLNQEDALPLGFKKDKDEKAIPLATPHNGAVQSYSWSSIVLTPSNTASIIEKTITSLAAWPANLANFVSPHLAIANPWKSWIGLLKTLKPPATSSAKNIFLIASASSLFLIIPFFTPNSIYSSLYLATASPNFSPCKVLSIWASWTSLLYPEVVWFIAFLLRPPASPASLIPFITVEAPCFWTNLGAKADATFWLAFNPILIGAPPTKPANPPTAPNHFANGSSKSRCSSSSTNAPGNPNKALSAKDHNPTPNAFARLVSEALSSSASNHSGIGWDKSCCCNWLEVWDFKKESTCSSVTILPLLANSCFNCKVKLSGIII